MFVSAHCVLLHCTAIICSFSGSTEAAFCELRITSFRFITRPFFGGYFVATYLTARFLRGADPHFVEGAGTRIPNNLPQEIGCDVLTEKKQYEVEATILGDGLVSVMKRDSKGVGPKLLY